MDFFLVSLIFGLSSSSILTLGSVFLGVLLFNVPLILLIFITFIYSGTSQLYLFEALILISFVTVTLIALYRKQQLSYKYEQSLALMKQYENITNLSTIVSKTDTEGVITFANENFCKISGYTKEEL
jgi:PAS domain-containing protein